MASICSSAPRSFLLASDITPVVPMNYNTNSTLKNSPHLLSKGHDPSTPPAALLWIILILTEELEVKSCQLNTKKSLPGLEEGGY